MFRLRKKGRLVLGEVGMSLWRCLCGIKADKMSPPKNTASSEGLFMLYGVSLL